MKIYNSARRQLSKAKKIIKRILRPDQILPVSSVVNIKLPYQLEIVPTRQNTKIIGANWLAGFKDNDHSEHGEDGIIAKIFEIMPPENKWVCEFGAHDPEIISNTWRLINQENWNAVLIEGDAYYAEKLKNYYKEKPTVHCLNDLVMFEGEKILDNILRDTPVPKNLDFMVIDIDGNDFHVWEAINEYRAKVVMIEFNASIPTDVSFVQPRDVTLNQGNSLKAMVELGHKKGYKLIAVTSWNAFFIQDQYYHLFFKDQPHLDDMYVYPAKHPIWMRPFQLYDGTIIVAPWNEMLWHKINLTEDDCQVLPSSMRTFSRDLANKDYIIEKSGKKSSLSEEVAAHLQKIYQMPGNVLGQFAANSYSRYGEDGILEKIIAAISGYNKFFIEVGAGDGVHHSRTRSLILNHHWSGLQLENDADLLLKLKQQSFSKEIKIHNGAYSISGENSLETIFAMHTVPNEPDVLVLSDYGMEYYNWESIIRYSPKIVAVQFNPTIPNDVKYIQPKNASIHQGVSLRALTELANYKGYELVAVTLETAFFVKRKYVYRLFELYGLKYSELDDMFCPALMRWFQLYDGKIEMQGLNRLMWHSMRIDEEKLQVVPKALEKFHQFADPDNKKHFYRV